MADPRPIREDRQLLMRMEAEVQDFLADTGFVFPAKYSGEFHMPSQVLVMTAFRHIYHQCIDVKYLFVAEPKKEVEEVMQLMSDIKYPLLGDLSKTKLSAPGSIHNWPPICGMLHWILCIKVSCIRAWAHTWLTIFPHLNRTHWKCQRQSTTAVRSSVP